MHPAVQMLQEKTLHQYAHRPGSSKAEAYFEGSSRMFTASHPSSR